MGGGLESIADTTINVLSEMAGHEPGGLVLDGPAGRLTYGQLDADVDRLAGWIAKRVGGTGTAVAVRTSSVRVAMTAFFAIGKCGCISVPIDPSAPLERALFMADDVEAKVILTDDVAFFGTDGRVVDVDSAIASGHPFGAALEMPDHAIATIVFTSGSTGVPKGTVTDWRRSRVGIERLREAGFPESSGRVCLPFVGTISNSVIMMSACVALGRTLVPYDVKRFGVQGLGEFLREQRIGAFATVPTLLRVLLDTASPDDTWPDLKDVITWGEGLTWHDVGRLRRHLGADAEIRSTYGTTEAGSIATFVVTAQTPLGRGLVPAGRPDARVVVCIVDPDGNDVPDGDEGEIVVAGDDVGVEYWRRPDLTERVFRTLPDGTRACWTGDRGRMLSDGNLQHLGRLDYMVKISGNRVDLGEIEVILRGMTDVAEAGVIARPDASGDNRIVAFVSARSGDVVPSDIRSRLLRKLPGYMIPDIIHVLDEIPTLPNGKVNRRALTELRIAPNASSETVEHGDELENRLATIWSDVLGCAVGRDDVLADLGADSIRSARAFVMIERQLGYDRPISLLLEAPTIAELAIRLHSGDETWHPLVPVRTTGSRAPLFVVHGGGGDVMFAVTLAEYLDPEMPVYGLQPSTLSGRVIGDVDVESLAKRYVAAIREVQHEGPYFLFGYSLGGLIAFEMACQLEKAGQRVALLGIGDTTAPGASRSREEAVQLPPLTLRTLPGRAVRSLRFRAHRRRRETSRRLTYWRMRLCVARGRAVPPSLRKEFSMWQLGLRSQTYRPTGISNSPTLLIRTDDAGGVTFEAWSAFITGPIETAVIPGKHMQLIHQPMIEQLGNALNEHCAAALASV